MKHLQASDGNCTRARHAGQSGSVRIIILSLACFLAGIGLSAAWLSRSTQHEAGRVVSNDGNAPALSDATKAVLHRLHSPVEIRFYSMLDASSVDASFQAFSGRVDRLIAQYQHEAGDKIQVTRCDSMSSANAAVADGIKPFNLNIGDGCFLGIAIVGNGQKESLSRLAPEWEQAVEFDLTRAVARVANPAPSAMPVARASTASLDAVRRSIPNLGSVSLEEGTQVLRAAALAQFQKAAQEMEAEINQARQNFLQAQTSQSEAGQQAALKRLQQIQAGQTDKLKQIAIDSQAQIAALQQIKGATH
jgi:hypothetical protein